MNCSKSTSQVDSHQEAMRDAQETAIDAEVLKRYRIIALIGTGNYGRVYKALTNSNKELAVKAINFNKISDHYRQKFLPRELTILKRLSHPNICKIYEIIQINERVFIVMQFCSRGTIADLLQKLGPLSEPICRSIFIPTTDAVVYLHNLELAHRDLKVENILLDSEFNPKLTDFSYAIDTSLNDKEHKKNQLVNHHNTSTYYDSSLPGNKTNHDKPKTKSIENQTNKLTRAKVKQQDGKLVRTHDSKSHSLKLNDTFCGTLPYLSPEVISQRSYDAKKTDCWALGICLYVMLNDRLPFPFDDIKQMVTKQMHRDYKFRTSIKVGESARDLISQLLEPEFIKRFKSIDVLNHCWSLGPRQKPSKD